MEKYQPYMQGLTPFRTSLEGIEVTALIDYIPADSDEGCDYPHGADVRHVIHEGADIIELMDECFIKTIAKRFLADLEESFERSKEP